MARQRTPQLPEQLADLTFPVQGIDLTAEFELQRPQTTPIGQNVRTYEALTQRGRGGVRPGLNQYIPVEVSGPNLIQHLNYIVDPQADALTTNFDPLDTPIVPLGLGWGFGPGPAGGPLSFPNYGFPTIVAATPNPAIVTGQGGVQMPNGFWTRTGGSGLQPNLSVGTVTTKPPPPPPGTLTLHITFNSFTFIIDGSSWISVDSATQYSTNISGSPVSFPIVGGSGPLVTTSVSGGADPHTWTLTGLTVSSAGFDVGDTPTQFTPGIYPASLSAAQGTNLSIFGSIVYDTTGTVTRSL